MGGAVPLFPNGYIPDNVLITFKSGTSAEGRWTHRLSVGSYMKHIALVALAKANTGKDLKITDGNNAYRDMAAQVYARQVHGNGAAYPGTSSHGGWWENRDTLAMDYGNWYSVYNGNRAAFYADVRAVGLTPGMISPERGYPDEPWHVVDLAPWAVPAGGVSPVPPVFTNENPENDDMERLMQIDPQINGAWYRVNYSKGTAVKIANGYQLDRAREEAVWEAGKPQPRIIEMGGPQPSTAIANLTIVNP